MCICIIKVNFTCCFLFFYCGYCTILDAIVAHVTFCQAGLLQRTQAPVVSGPEEETGEYEQRREPCTGPHRQERVGVSEAAPGPCHLSPE